MQAGHPQAAIQRLEKLLVTQPGQVQLAFNLIGARCMTGGIQATDLAAARTAMQGTPNTGTLFARCFDRTLPDRKSVVCGKSVSVRLDPVGRRCMKKQTQGIRSQVQSVQLQHASKERI